MATASFERSNIITDREAQKKLEAILAAPGATIALKVPPYTDEERKKNEEKFLKCLSHSEQ